MKSRARDRHVMLYTLVGNTVKFKVERQTAKAGHSFRRIIHRSPFCTLSTQLRYLVFLQSRCILYIQPLMMTALRPLRFEAALNSCTKSSRSASYRNALLRPRHHAPRSRRRWQSDGPKLPSGAGSQETPNVIAPKTRIAIGVVFIGALIYSMVG